MILIDINETEGGRSYSLSGNLEIILTNRRLVTSFRRLKYAVSSDNSISIPIQQENGVELVQEICRLLEKFKIDYAQSEKIKNSFAAYTREEESFAEFSNQAKLIKNDAFNQHPELVSLFDQFQEVITEKFSPERTLYQLQLLSAFHLAFSQNACNFAVPGAGKTTIVYAAYAYLSSLSPDDPKYVNRLIVIGPISSFAPWEKEYKECFGQEGKFQRLSGDASILKPQKLEHLYSANPAEVSLIFHGGVDSLQEDIKNFLKKHKTMVVVDEAHRIKNPEGTWGESVTEISKEAVSRVILTGTPLPNGYQDIFNLYKFIYPFKYKEIIKFHYHNLVEMSKEESQESHHIENLKNNLSPYFIRIKKNDLKQLEKNPIIETIKKIEMGDYQRSIYDAIESNYVDSFKNKPTAEEKDFINKAKLIRLRQAASNPALLAKPLKESMEHSEYGDFDPNSEYANYSDLHIDDSDFLNRVIHYSELETPAKYLEALNLINTIPSDGKLIIWTIFIQNAKSLADFLESNNIKTELLIGEVEQSKREGVIDLFNNPHDMSFKVVIANPFSVAESISLHKGCHNALYLERDYNCSNFLQSKDRIHRVGLEEGQETNYYYFVCNDSIDEVIHDKLIKKIKRMESIINDDIPLFTRLNETDETDIIQALLDKYARRS